jgi:glycosyltransferase involved in cell wall biosynthesis
MSRREPREIVIFSTADWATPYWTNKQHIASRLAKRGWSVLYVETVGLRAPGFGRADGARLMRRLTGAAASPRAIADRLWVASPLSVPIGHRFTAVRDFNAKALSSALGTWLAKLGFRRPIIWTYHPFMLAAIAGIDRAALVYHCVDELAAIPGIDAEAISAAERTLLLAADMVFATSPALREKCAALSPACHHLPNVADIDHFAVARRPSTLPPDLAAIARPRLGYAGVLSDFKVNFPLMLDLAERQPDWQLVLIGEERAGQRDPILGRLRERANVHILGWRDYRDLPSYFGGLDLGLLPLRENSYTRAVFPMKYFEYLAAGLPVVSTALPALCAYDGLHRTADAAEFATAISDVLADRPRYVIAPDHPVLREHDWERQLDRMLALLDPIL